MANDKIFVTKPSLPEFEEYINEIKYIWESNILTNFGDIHNKLLEQLKKYLSVPNVSLFTNGHIALTSALKALGKKGEVITTPFTFVSTTLAIVDAGLTPVFCDIDPENYTIDVNMIESLITSDTVAILPVHVYGNICNVSRIEEIAKKYDLKVIYDAAHCFGIEHEGKAIGCYGDISMFSFHATKVFNTIEGGALVYRDENLSSVLKKITNFGLDTGYNASYIGTNGKMNEFQAAMGICNLKKVDENIQARKYVYKKYMELLSDVKGIVLPKIKEATKGNYSYFPIQVDKASYGISKNKLMELLNSNGIYPREYFYPLINEFDAYKGFGTVKDTPIAKQISERILCLPMYSSLTDKDIERICTIIVESNKGSEI